MSDGREEERELELLQVLAAHRTRGTHGIGPGWVCTCGTRWSGSAEEWRSSQDVHLAEALREASALWDTQAYARGREDQATATIGYCELSLSFIEDNPDPLAVGLAKGYQDIAEKSRRNQWAGEKR